MNSVLKHVRKLSRLTEAETMTDGQLLDAFVRAQDVTAFEALVRRHGPMVLGVCRRVLRHMHDAEDAFQATFLVLFRRAVSLGRREVVGNWLYGVAYRTALKARAAAARRRVKEQAAARPEEAPAPTPRQELQTLLDQEVSRLPDKYRIPVALCELQGKTRKEAAQQLGWPEGTVAGRLARARALLARRLAGYGPPLSAVALAAVFSQDTAAAALPTPLVARTVGAITALAAGPVVTGATSSTRVTALAEGAIRGMFLVKTRVVLALALTACALVAGGIVGYRTWAGQGQASPPAPSTPGGSADQKPGESREASRELEGEWTVVIQAYNGEVAAGDRVRGMKFVFSGDKLVMESPRGNIEFRVRLDAATNPRTLDIKRADPRVSEAWLRGIYRHRGDFLDIAVDMSGKGSTRPAGFETRRGSPVMQWTLRRKG
jgi:RNA polymerase sigma-70 factor (ECF subfamily)